MFSSPAIRVFSEENNMTVVKKPGLISTSTKKPFSDRAVNASPQRKPEVNIKKQETQLSKALSPSKDDDDDLFFYDSFSYKTVGDFYFDIENLSEKAIFNCLSSYSRYNSRTPPPELSDDIDTFLEMPENDFSIEQEDSLLEDSIEEVTLPEIHFD